MRARGRCGVAIVSERAFWSNVAGASEWGKPGSHLAHAIKLARLDGSVTDVFGAIEAMPKSAMGKILKADARRRDRSG